MSARTDRLIDPTRGDLVRVARGMFAKGDVLWNKIAFSLCVALGSWEGDPTIGHRFGELARAVESESTEHDIRDRVQAALQWLLDEGELQSLAIDVERQAPGRWAFQGTARSATGAEVPFGPYFVEVG